MSLLGAVSQLRTEIEQIDEMSDLIPGEREQEKRTIMAKIRECLADLENLEKTLGLGGSSYNDASQSPMCRKEINV